MKIRVLAIAAALGLSVVASPVMAETETLRDGIPICVSKDKMDELSVAFANTDTEKLGKLEREDSCTLTPRGLPFTTLRIVEKEYTPTGMSYAQVRILTSNDLGYVDMWVWENATWD